MTIRRAAGGFVFLICFAFLLYSLLWGWDFYVQYFPDFRLRRAYMVFSLRQRFGIALPSEARDFLIAMTRRRPDIAEGLIHRAFFSLLASAVFAVVIVCWPWSRRKKNEKHIRGSRLVNEKHLRNLTEKE